MKHALVAFSIFVLSTLLFVGLQAVEGVDANFLPRGVPDAPPIIISSPLNTTYTQNDVLLNFTIVGISNWWVPSYHLTSLYYEIDGNSTNIAFPTGGINVEQYSVLIASLAKGQYTLTIHAHATGLHRNNYPKSGTTQYFIESNQTVSFTIDKELENTPSPTNSPSLTPTSTSTSTSTSTPTSNSESPLTSTNSPAHQPTATASELSGWLILSFLIVIVSIVAILAKQKQLTL